MLGAEAQQDDGKTFEDLADRGLKYRGGKRCPLY